MEEITIPTAPESITDAAMDEHRAALTKMRCDFALEQLYAASGAHDPAVLRRLIDIGEDDITVGEDGIPDVTAVKDKIEVLRREQSYLFRNAPAAHGQTPVSAPAPVHEESKAATGMRLGVMQKSDYAQLDDASYYRAVMARGSRRR